MRCVACGFHNRTGVRFCEDCGASLVAVCPACGVEVPGGRKFCGSCGAALAPGTDVAGQGPAEEAPHAAWARQPGDRRPVTLLFADITGSTALTERLDAEETHELLYGAVRHLGEAVESSRGTVCRFMGDGLMAVFGAPRASEDHALDACRAALAMQAAIAAYGAGIEARHGAALRIRVGLHSGEVVMLRVGEGEGTGWDASGPSVPIAARMEQAAEPGTVLVTAETRALAGARVRARSRPAIRVKGISEPLEVFVLEGLREADEAPPPEHGPLIGRRAELAQLRSAIHAVREGEGQAVHVRGDAGIGKTRFVAELTALARQTGFICHKGRVLDSGAGRGWDATRMLVRGLLGVPALAGPDERAGQVEAALARGLLDADERVFANDLLDLAQPPALRSLYDAMPNTERVRGLRRLVVELARRTSRVHPLLLVVEDLHWADQGMLEQLAALTAAAHECALLLVTTARIEGDPVDGMWRARIGETPLSNIELGPLRREEAASLLGRLMAGEDGLAARCLERAAGNPLFLEQLARGARERSGDDLPETIQTLILTRVDRLDETDRHALYAGAVLGQQVALDALRHVAGLPDFETTSLVEHHLIRPEGGGYLFAHALIRDGVYASLLRATRRRLHRRAAEWFAASDPVLHAEHLAQADDPGAAPAFLRAALFERAGYRFEVARGLAERGLALAVEAAERHELTRLLGDVLLDLGEAEEAIERFREALHLAPDGVARCRARIGMAGAMRIVEHVDEAFETLDAAEIDAAAADLALELARIHHLRGNLYFPLGEFDACRAAHEQALEAARRARSAEVEAAALGGLGDAAYARGRMRTARDHFERCAELCRRHALGRIELANEYMLGFSRLYLNQVHQAVRDAYRVIAAARQLGHGRAELVSEHLACFALTERGDYKGALEHAEHSLRIAERLGAARFAPHSYAVRAQALAALGRKRESLEAREAALAGCRRSPANMQFTGARVFGIAALLADSPRARRGALAEGEHALAEGSLSHCHLFFHRDAMTACLYMRDFAGVERHARALEDYTRDEPLPWARFYVERARALVIYTRGAEDATLRENLSRLREEATAAGLEAARPGIDDALAGC